MIQRTRFTYACCQNGFCALAEELIQEGTRRSTRASTHRARWQLKGFHVSRRSRDSSMYSPPRSSSVSIRRMSWARIALHFKDQCRRAPLGIRRLPAQELARERVHTGGRLAGPDGPENRHAGIEAPLRDRQPFGSRALDGSDRVMDLADDDRRPIAESERGQRGRRDRSPTRTPIRANQIRDVLMRNCPASSTATPGRCCMNRS